MKARLQIGNEMRKGVLDVRCYEPPASGKPFCVWDFRSITLGRVESPATYEDKKQALEHFKFIGGVIIEEEGKPV